MRSRGFTLVEMLVIAPIVILTIGVFIALIVNLTGDVMTSRGSNSVTYDVQSTLNRIEDDVKLSTGFLATNNISFTAGNPQGYSADGSDSTTDFSNIGNGTGPILILNALVTSGNPLSLSSRTVYLDKQPETCSLSSSDSMVFSKNRPMTYNIVYFVDGSGTLWRRTIMPTNYNTGPYSQTAANQADPNKSKCGVAWQQPSCSPLVDSHNAFCITSDERLLELGDGGVFDLQYFTGASGTTNLTAASDPSITDAATRAAAMQPATTLMASITANKNIAGRSISKSGTLRASRADGNATSIATPAIPTNAPAIPVVSGLVNDGHIVTFSWPRVADATAYDLRYRINSGTWQTASDIGNNDRSYAVTSATHTDTVEAQVLAKNTCSSGSCQSNWSASSTVAIPLWAPLILQSGWTRYDTTYSSPAYTKTKAGVVVLKGMVKAGTLAATLAELPDGYRPSAATLYEVSSNQSACRLDTYPTGGISINAICNNAWVSLDSINYMAADTNFTNMTPFVNGWNNYSAYSGDPAWVYASYATDSLGRVHTRGLIGGGVSTDSTATTSFPSSLAPAGFMHVANINSDQNNHIGINSAGQVYAKGGGNSWLSLQAMFYPASARSSGSSCTTQWCSLPLANGWVHYGSPFTTPEYTKSSDNIVQIKGLLKSGANAAAISGTIPAGFCPKERLLFVAEAAGAWGRVDVVPNGAGAGCYLLAVTTSTTWTSLDSIIYIGEQ